MAHMICTGRTRRTRGAATVELVFVLLILVLFTFSVIEYGWMFFRVQQITNAAQAGARRGALVDATNADINAAVNQAMADWGLAGSGYNVNVSANVSNLNSGDIFTVTITVPYANIQILGMSIIPTPGTLTGVVSMAREGAA